jgi:protein TonB
MSDVSPASWLRRSGAVRWGACFVLAVAFHGAGVAALLARWHDDNDLLANAPVITIDLAPMAVSPTQTETDLPPDKVESKEQIDPDPTPEKPIEETKVEPEPEPDPPEKVEVPPDPTPKPELAVLPPPKLEKPKEKKPKKHKMASVARNPVSAPNQAAQAAAPSPGANGNPRAVPNWMSELSAQLERHKRYPSDGAGSSGVVQVAFSVDRSGGVHNTRIVRSSGSSALDQAALSLVSRASPLPPPPPERPGTHIPITVPIRYSAR